MAEIENPFIKRFHELVVDMERVFTKKNHDYSGKKDPYSSFRDFGWKGVVVRIGDKYHRIKNFSAQENLEVKDETIMDTLQDLAVYAVIAAIMYEKEKEESK